MSDNSFEKQDKKPGEYQKNPLAKFNQERQERLDKLCILSLVGISITMVMTFHMATADPRVTKHWTLIFAVTLAFVVIFSTWLVSSWKQHYAWEKAEKAKLPRK